MKRKVTFIVKTTVSGSSLEDVSLATDYLADEGSPVIDVPALDAIAKDIQKELKTARFTAEQNGRMISDLQFTRIPDTDEIKEALANKKTLRACSNEKAGFNHSEVTAEIFEAGGGNIMLVVCFCHGLFLAYSEYKVLELNAEDVVIYAIENFLCPKTRVLSVARIRSRAFKIDEIGEALKAKDAIAANLWSKQLAGAPSRAELLISTEKRLRENANDWYMTNLKAYNLREQHPEKELFKMYADEDIAYLEQKK